MWGPQEITKLVNITPITMVYGTYNYSYWGESKPTYNYGAPHCINLPLSSSPPRPAGSAGSVAAELPRASVEVCRPVISQHRWVVLARSRHKFRELGVRIRDAFNLLISYWIILYIYINKYTSKDVISEWNLMGIKYITSHLIYWGFHARAPVV